MRKHKSYCGFTVTELVIVSGIMVLISTLVLANYKGFNERLALRSAVEDIAGIVRQTQAYSLGVKEFGAGSGIFPGYGVYFSSAPPNNFYIVFADTNNNSLYDPPAEKINEIIIQSHISISDLRADQKQSPPGVSNLSSLSAVYLRPNPTVALRSGASSYSDIEIVLKSSTGLEKKIVIWSSGQVSIE